MNILSNICMGLTSSNIKKANYEDIQSLQKNNNDMLLINTLNSNEQICLINGTLSYYKEENLINNMINTRNYNTKIIVYGKNYSDYSAYKKYEQLNQLGFLNVYIYVGGLFEWLCLQDIYGNDFFKTTSKELDIIKYKPVSNISMKAIE